MRSAIVDIIRTQGADVKDGALQLASSSELDTPIDASGELFSPEATSASQ